MASAHSVIDTAIDALVAVLDHPDVELDTDARTEISLAIGHLDIAQEEI